MIIAFLKKQKDKFGNNFRIFIFNKYHREIDYVEKYIHTAKMD